ncbi:thiamine pyrophosphate-dependent dehydrogenase E1 component subunit alpha [Sulfuritalea sp.]|uniref:thiamine pyrophosphate-dependent dehydrogenase E1 component subunit alpha n=1 Tax=Sulfuritalea sp. TaxID=2480090 RepID=UPI001AD5A3C1|nr:thiamine pyrophosphate-dependent dehydrogenase E1 component subunit alpha [Sulfuritalea sp.]MBN8476316.1 thiamine pyrophosphate-dependent dehydrogenase E1 component subunit alpha [Sulfuritalea sp.]
MALNGKQKKLLFTNLVRAHALDRMMMRIIRAGKMVGFYHEGGIALAPGVAAGSFLRQDDAMNPHYRAHGLAHMIGKGVDLRTYVAEHMGRVDGCCKGRSSFHVSFPDHHIFGWSGNIGANFPPCIGYGFAARYRGTDQVVMNCSGDGSYQEGRAHEAMLMSANWKLPHIFWCENNGISQSTAASETFPVQDVSRLAATFEIPALIVDGQDLFACGEAALKAIAHARAGKGPFFVELKTYRSQEHNVGGLNNEGAVTRDPKLMQEWRETLDPVALAAAKLIKQRLYTADEIEQIKADAEREADEIELFCEASPKATPSIDELMNGVYAQ